MPTEIRTLRADELPAYLDAIGTAFLSRPDVDRIAEEVRPYWDLDRTWAAVDSAFVCGTLRSWATEITVPGGGQLPTAAISAVTVRPTHRRRGLLRGMVAAEHEAARERGEVAALLYASEYPIYGRFGYGPATRTATWTLNTLLTGFHRPQPGGVEQVGPGPEARDLMRAVFDAARQRQPGEIRRRDITWEYDVGRETSWGPAWSGWIAVRRSAAGDVDGFARYHAEEKWEDRQPRSVVVVDDLHVLGDEAYLALWRFLAEIDLVATVRAERRSLSERLPWLLTNARAAIASETGDGAWLRLFDLPRAMEARTYQHEASMVLEIVDPEAPGGRLRVRLDAGSGGARCRKTTASPDLTLPITAIASAYLGGVPLGAAVAAGGADEHRGGALAGAEVLLRTRDEPWCSTHF
jgi:predicted acetyltransferase